MPEFDLLEFSNRRIGRPAWIRFMLDTYEFPG